MVQQYKLINEGSVRDALAEVMDPEIPVLSVIDLGIIEGIHIREGSVKVNMIPTFTACPAIHLMKDQIKEKMLSLGFKNVSVEVDKSISWNSDRISEAGRHKLKQFGLGISPQHHGHFDLKDIERARCPFCASENTTMNSLFGSTLCRSVHYCFDCRQSFERFKPL